MTRTASARGGLFAGLLLALFALPSAAEEVTIFGAASTAEVMEEAARTFEAESGTEVTVVLAGSSTLARQIEAGAPADLFLSANRDWVQYLADRGLTATGGGRALFGTSLVLVAPRDSAMRLKIEPGMALRAALGDGRLALGDPDHVPAGIYAKAALVTLGVWESVVDRLAPTADVRAALALVERGEVAAAIVYATDLKIARGLRLVGTFPGDSHPPIVYWLVRIAGHDSPSAIAFEKYLKASAVQEIYRRHGFAPGG
ncbi:MAG: molybdate ABC transporter substrate-binding protein [Kiloniellales bacterium]